MNAIYKITIESQFNIRSLQSKEKMNAFLYGKIKLNLLVF